MSAAKAKIGTCTTSRDQANPESLLAEVITPQAFWTAGQKMLFSQPSERLLSPDNTSVCKHPSLALRALGVKRFGPFP